MWLGVSKLCKYGSELQSIWLKFRRWLSRVFLYGQLYGGTNFKHPLSGVISAKSGCPGNTSAPNTDWFMGICSQNFVTDDSKSGTKEWSWSLWSQSTCPPNNSETKLVWLQQRKNSQISVCCYVYGSSRKVTGAEGNARVGCSVKEQSRYSGLTLASFPYLLLQPELLLSRSLWLPPALLWCMRHKMPLEGRDGYTSAYFVQQIKENSWNFDRKAMNTC